MGLAENPRLVLKKCPLGTLLHSCSFLHMLILASSPKPSVATPPLSLGAFTRGMLYLIFSVFNASVQLINKHYKSTAGKRADWASLELGFTSILLRVPICKRSNDIPKTFS